MANVYVHLGEVLLPLAVSTQRVSDEIYVDYDHHGNAIGIEILGATAVSVNGVRLRLPDED
jgi:uncharacterized protein YuzE